MVAGRFSNPHLFLRFVHAIFPWVAGLTVLLLAAGLFLAFTSPPDYKQQELVRIIYVHVPMAWISMGCYVLIALSGFGVLVWRHPLAGVCARAAIPPGMTFTGLTLITGAIWGKPTWGVFWVWDARLTSVLILFFLYLGLMTLSKAIEDQERSSQAVAILSLVGLVNIPIIKFSVDWWNSLHQPASIFRSQGPTLHLSMLTPLIVMGLGFTFLFIAIHMAAMENHILRRRIHVMRLMQNSCKSENKPREIC